MLRTSLLKAGVISEVISDSNEIRTHNQLVRKRTLKHLAKLVYRLAKRMADTNVKGAYGKK